MAFTAADVKNLRERTGCGMMDCKKALTETNGDMEKAIDFLREKGMASAAKKSGRIAAEGAVVAYNDQVNNVSVIIEVNAETDFVAKNEEFKDLCNIAAKTVAEQNPATVEELLTMVPAGQTMTVEEIRQDKFLKIGENIKIRRFARYEGAVVSYIHGGGRIGVMVKCEVSDGIAQKEEFVNMAKDVAMQIAAINPSYLAKESISAESLEHEKAIMMEQIMNDPKNSNKPQNIIETRILPGRVEKFYKENCLLEQAFVKDDSMSVGAYVANTAKALGGEIKVVDYVRFEKGEGLEKREDNLADEVASMMK